MTFETFQFSGKKHIRYIQEMARKAWEQSNASIPYDACLLDAMKRHRDYVKRMFEANQYYQDSLKRKPPTKFSALDDL